MKERVDARKTRFGPSDLTRLLDGTKTVLVSDGRSVRRFDLTQRDHDRTDLLARMVGPTGNLRAPTFRRDGLLVVGFHADSMAELLK